MKKLFCTFFITVICFGFDNNVKTKRYEQLKNYIRETYNIKSLEDLRKFEPNNSSIDRSIARQMDDFLGRWSVVEQKILFNVKVGTDQSLINPMSLMGMVEAEGSITVSSSEFTEHLNYILDSEQLDDMFGDEGGSCDPCEGVDGCGNYYSESECTNNTGCEWYGSDGPGCENCEPCGGINGCGAYFDEGECVIVDGCEWYGWQNGPGCSDNNFRSRTHSDTLIFEDRDDMNYARYGAAYTTDGDYIYAFNGAEYDPVSDSTIYHLHGEKYDPHTDSWEMFGDSLSLRRYTVAEYVNGNIYIFNGNSDINTVDILNTSDGTLSKIETNPFPVTYGGSAVWNEKIYLFGGYYFDDNLDDDVYSNRLYVFDPADESWIRLADMPVSANTNGVIVDGVLYTFGGYNGSVLSDINAYDINTDTWQSISQMPLQLSAHSVATDGSLIYIIGDYSNNLSFTGVFDPSGNDFYDKTSNMIGRRHSSSVFLGGYIYAFGGAQPAGYDGNDFYTTLSSLQAGELMEQSDEDEGTELLVMNMHFMDFFALLFGATPEELGITNPMILAVSFEELENENVVISEVQISILNEDGIEAEALQSELINLSNVDTLSNTISFENLNLYDSTGTSILTIDGSIGPKEWELEAGVETLIDMIGDSDEPSGSAYLYFYDDSTGMTVRIEDDDYYYYDSSIDTSFFEWSATSDSLQIINLDEYGYINISEFEYSISNDSLYIRQVVVPCENSSDEDCLQMISDDYGLGELEDLQGLKIENNTILFLEEYNMNTEISNSYIPEKFNLYPNYPNPFNPVTTIRFDVAYGSTKQTTISIYDISGRKITDLVNKKLSAGTYEVQWNSGKLASGVYFYELVSGNYRHTRKMILLK